MFSDDDIHTLNKTANHDYNIKTLEHCIVVVAVVSRDETRENG